MHPKLFLVPNFIADTHYNSNFPLENSIIASTLDIWVVESSKTAYRSLRKLMPEKNLDHLVLYELNEHTSDQELFDLLKLLDKDKSIGLMSEAGMPALADPGTQFIRAAHQKKWQVQPLIGPCSIVQALVASGLNGQKFSFHGYLSRNENELKKQLRGLEKKSQKELSAEIFMETPFRNNKTIETLLNTLYSDTDLCIAANLSSENETVITQSVEQWKKSKWDYHKIPAIFVLQS